MTTGEIEIGDVVACREQETGQVGLLHVEADRIWVEFVGFGTRPSFEVDDPLHLHTAEGWVVTLFDNVEFSPMMPSWRRGDVGHVYHKRILSNLALAGETAWLADDRAQSAFFRLAPECDFLWPKDRAAAIAEMPDNTNPERTVFTLSVPGGELSLTFALQSDPIRDKWVPTKPYFTLRFDEGAAPAECLDWIWYLVNLFALLSWRDVRSVGVSIRRTDADERIYAHRVLSAGLRDKLDHHETKTISLTPLSAHNEAERDAMQAVLLTWLERKADWEKASGLMWGALRRFKNVSAERALDACRWHETIERTQKTAGPPRGMEKVVEAAVREARQCGLEDYVDQIKGSLRGVRGEPRKLLFTRLTREVNGRLGHSIFDEVSAEMIRGAYRARNRTGHGAIGSMSETGVRTLWEDILAMEALCAARMMAELPFSESGRRQLDRHPLFRAFRELRDERRNPNSPLSDC